MKSSRKPHYLVGLEVVDEPWDMLFLHIHCVLLSKIEFICEPEATYYHMHLGFVWQNKIQCEEFPA